MDTKVMELKSLGEKLQADVLNDIVEGSLKDWTFNPNRELIINLEKYADGAYLCYFRGNEGQAAFCGLFISSNHIQSNGRLFKRDLRDFFSFRTYKTGKPYVDRRIVIHASGYPKVKVNHTIAVDFLELQKRVGALYLETEEIPTYCKSVFPDQSTISLRSKTWIRNEDQLKDFIVTGIRILKGLNRYLHG